MTSSSKTFKTFIGLLLLIVSFVDGYSSSSCIENRCEISSGGTLNMSYCYIGDVGDEEFDDIQQCFDSVGRSNIVTLKGSGGSSLVFP